MAWSDLIATSGFRQTMNRAKSALNHKTEYKLGAGGFDPSKPLTPECDCSGFIAWAIGIPRELPPGSGSWLSTVEYWNCGSGRYFNLFTVQPLNKSNVGDLLVYPDSGGKQGHIALITKLELDMPGSIIHCSSGNYKSVGDAICVTNPAVFLSNRKTRVVRIDYGILRWLPSVNYLKGVP